MRHATATSHSRALVQEGAGQLAAAGREQARHEVEWLLSRLLGLRPLELYLMDDPVPEPVVERFFSQIRARASGVPLQYLLGEADFCGRSFIVRPGVFIPRPETEGVVQAAIDSLRPLAQGCRSPLRLLELGVGSGCISATLAYALPTCVVVGIEVLWEPLRTAQENLQRHGLSGRVSLVQGRWTDAVRGRFHGIVSNPPYVPTTDVDRLPLDVRQEPRVSLDGGGNGMRDLLSIVHCAADRLEPAGVLVLECGESQVPHLMREAWQAAWVEHVRGLRDLAGRPRGILAVAKTSWQQKSY
ncbi:MAG: protein-(glutamine-N5) methyltransferase, release factor-specific [Candidatus Omnitrophica bacterium CG11_big_fil_rev_8_21_14_0_20_63_9]|nr:MAG: protein-(glutamine-N5) methyltransferase, release factor-specific [Candidatus Omnitrophica bacterium CG11_big_fil_rev_8_21_14_0_20_63_9]